MGYSMQVSDPVYASNAHPSLLQWSISPAPANLSDIIISRLLEHYSVCRGAVARPSRADQMQPSADGYADCS